MKKFITLLLFLTSSIICSQEYTEEELEETIFEDVEIFSKKIERDYNGNKNTDYDKKRDFKEDLNKKYDFKYTPEKEIKKESEELKKKRLKNKEEALLNFKNTFELLATITPYLLGLLTIFIIIKSVIKTDTEFWKFGKNKTLKKEKLVYEEHENINETNFEKLIQKAIINKDYRLATRFFYLISLQKLSEKELIKYHKDKTNTDYQFELNNKNLQREFSYISYIYNYVWYGEFKVDEPKFNTIRTSFNNFLKTI